MSTRFVPQGCDPTNPPEGVRLELGVTAGQMRVSVSDLAEASGISRSAIFNLMTANRWPVRSDAAAIKRAIEQLMREKGATEDQVAVLWHAHVAGKGPRRDHTTTDNYGRDPGRNDPKDTDMLMPKQSLSMAARKAFQLFVNPFDGEVIEDSQMFNSGEIAYVREACMQAAVGGRFVAIVGESGSGKTTIVGDLQSRIDRDHRSVMLIKPPTFGMEESDSRGKVLKATDILATIIAALDPLSQIPQTLEARSRKVAKLLAASIESGWQHALLIEDAHRLSDSTLNHLKDLHEMRLARKPMIGVLLVGQPELGAKLDPRRAHMRQVSQRCELVHLLPLDGDLKSYLAHRASTCKRELVHFLQDDAIEEIRARLTVLRPALGGKAKATSLLYPLAVNNMVTACLNVAAELGVPVVNRDVVRAV